MEYEKCYLQPRIKEWSVRNVTSNLGLKNGVWEMLPPTWRSLLRSSQWSIRVSIISYFSGFSAKHANMESMVVLVTAMLKKVLRMKLKNSVDIFIHLPLKRRVFKTAITEYKILGFPNSLISTLNPAEVSILHSNLWFSSWGQKSEQDSQEQDEQGGEEDCTGVRQPKQTGKPSGRLHKTKNNKKLLYR